MHTHTLKNTTTLLFDGADFFRAIGDPKQISPFIAIGLIFIYVLYKLASAKVQGNKQQQIQKQRIQQQKLEKKRMEQMQNFYFIKYETGNISEPMDKFHVIEMLNRGEVNLQSPVRKGIDNHDFKPLKVFPELIENMNDFV